MEKGEKKDNYKNLLLGGGDVLGPSAEMQATVQNAQPAVVGGSKKPQKSKTVFGSRYMDIANIIRQQLFGW